MDSSLTCRVLAEAGLEDAAHHALVRISELEVCCGPGQLIGLTCEASAPRYLANHQRAQLWRGKRLERALKLAHRSAHGRNDYGFSHHYSQISRPVG